MKRTVQVLGGLGLAGAVLLGGTASASADTHHKDSRSAAKSGHAAAERVTHHCATAKRCRPKPLPRPVGGWPCAKTHSCSTKHHRPICKPPVKPPVRPPHHKPPAPKPPAVHRVPVAAPVPEGLPRTGSNVLAMVLTASGLIGGGVGFKRLGRARVR